MGHDTGSTTSTIDELPILSSPAGFLNLAQNQTQVMIMTAAGPAMNRSFFADLYEGADISDAAGLAMMPSTYLPLRWTILFSFTHPHLRDGYPNSRSDRCHSA